MLNALVYVFCAIATAPQARDEALLVKGGTVITLSIGTLPTGDVLIRGDRVVRVAPRIGSESAERVIDASEHFVLPGFVIIDLESRATPLRSMDSEVAWLSHGVTEVFERRADELLDELVRVRLDVPSTPVARVLDLGRTPGLTAERLRAAHVEGRLASRRDADLLMVVNDPRDGWIARRLASELSWQTRAEATRSAGVEGRATDLVWRVRSHGVEMGPAFALGKARPEFVLWHAAGARLGEDDAEEALRAWIQYPILMLGLRLEAGRIVPRAIADLALFDRHPLTRGARCVATIVGGRLAWVDAAFEGHTR